MKTQTRSSHRSWKLCLLPIFMAPALQAATLIEYNFDTVGTPNYTFSDISGNGRDVKFPSIVQSNNNPFAQPPAYNKSVNVTGVTGAVQNPGTINLNSSNQFTMELWVNFANFAQTATVVSLRNAATTRMELYVQGGGTANDGMVYARFYSQGQPTSSAFLYSTSLLSLNTWSQIAYSYDGTNMHLYINAVEVVAPKYVGYALSPQLDSIYLNSNVGATPANYLMDDFRLSNVALSPDQLGYWQSFSTIPEPASVSTVIGAVLCLVSSRLFQKKKGRCVRE